MPLKFCPAKAARNGAGTETRPFLSICFSNVDKNNATTFTLPTGDAATTRNKSVNPCAARPNFRLRNQPLLFRSYSMAGCLPVVLESIRSPNFSLHSLRANAAACETHPIWCFLVLLGIYWDCMYLSGHSQQLIGIKHIAKNPNKDKGLIILSTKSEGLPLSIHNLGFTPKPAPKRPKSALLYTHDSW